MNTQRIVGIDEAGRGPWAGPVVAAAVILPEGFDLQILGDSKKLTKKQRQTAYHALCTQAEVHIGVVSATEIDRGSIKTATHHAMTQALEGFIDAPRHALVDGKDNFSFAIPSTSIVKGDAKEAVIGAASIIAKEFRDHLMELYHSLYPQYGFNRHKGYGTKFHQEQLARFGPCPIHRKSFAPIQRLLG